MKDRMRLAKQVVRRWVRRSRISTAVGPFAALAVCGAFTRSADATVAPHSNDPLVKVSLFAAEPEIVTPIGAAIDAKGRLLVVESNSHFRPKNYQGPATDRIRLFQNTVADEADGVTTFFEGANYLMNLAPEKEGSIVVSSRNEIFRLAEHRGATAGVEKLTLAHLETTAFYPHNGLHGLTVARDGHIYFGIGENLGGAYTLVGADGKKLSDDKGSGAIFRVDAKGNDLTLIARGFWNPFGLGTDAAGNLWAVDNDPDGRPPCRLIHVVPGAEYGFEFRYGRTGMHPLQAWDGELPGTLKMVAGVGEAPCAVVWHGGALYVSSWRDHQVQAYHLTPNGASYTATTEALLMGDENFRPVGLAFAKDGSLFVTDWASSSYSVNNKGRIWKVTLPASYAVDPAIELTPQMRQAEALRRSQDVDELVKAMDSADAAIAQAAQFGLSQLPASEKIEWKSMTTPRQKIGLLASLLWRGADVTALIEPALKDDNDQVRQMGVRSTAEQNIKAARPALDALLHSQVVMSPRLLGMTIATINQLDGDRSAKIDSKTINSVLLERMSSGQTSDAARAIALHMLQNSHPAIALADLNQMARSADSSLAIEATRYLTSDSAPGRLPILAALASDVKLPPAVRAEAIVGLADDAANQIDLLLKGVGDANAAIRQESLRSIRSAVSSLTAAQKQQMVDAATHYPADADLVHRVMGEAPAARPPENELAAWQKILDAGAGDPDAGRRIFFHPAGPGCFHCHMVEGRGRSIGPDLTMIGHAQTREHVLESILDPSKEIAPLFTLWSIKTKSGQQVDGMLLRRDGQENEVYVDASGVETTVREPTIIERHIRKESLMPSGLAGGMTDQELRDLVSFLVQKR